MQRIQRTTACTVFGLLSLFLGITLFASVSQADDASPIPVPGMVTMVDLGAKKCIPCKMMAPIMEEMEK
jgi:thioredoxin 1